MEVEAEAKDGAGEECRVSLDTSSGYFSTISLKINTLVVKYWSDPIS